MKKDHKTNIYKSACIVFSNATFVSMNNQDADPLKSACHFAKSSKGDTRKRTPIIKIKTHEPEQKQIDKTNLKHPQTRSISISLPCTPSTPNAIPQAKPSLRARERHTGPIGSSEP